jgi:hypothetical protein
MLDYTMMLDRCKYQIYLERYHSIMTSTARFCPAIQSFAFANTLAVLAWDQFAPPRSFYSDLLSGPNSGRQNNAGAFVTIYGKYFVATQGGSTVTVGGDAVDFSTNRNHNAL